MIKSCKNVKHYIARLQLLLNIFGGIMSITRIKRIKLLNAPHCRHIDTIIGNIDQVLVILDR